MDYKDIDYNHLYMVIERINKSAQNRLNKIEWWSINGKTEATVLTREMTKNDCLNKLNDVEINIKKIRHYAETGRQGVEDEYQRIMKQLDEIGGVM